MQNTSNASRLRTSPNQTNELVQYPDVTFTIHRTGTDISIGTEERNIETLRRRPSTIFVSNEPDPNIQSSTKVLLRNKPLPTNLYQYFWFRGALFLLLIEFVLLA